jgi:DUF177 domain-containing protein
MSQLRTTIIDLSRLSLAHGEGKRIEVPVELDPFELGGQTYSPNPPSPAIRLEASRPSGGFAFRIRFQVHLEGPCMRCLDPASLDLDVESREVDQADTDDAELRSPYVEDDELDIGRWAHDATLLALPTRFLCRADCAGLCAVCGEPLNNADPSDHEHETATDPRWSALKDLKLE